MGQLAEVLVNELVEGVPGEVLFVHITGFPGEPDVYVYRDPDLRRWRSVFPPALSARPVLRDAVERIFAEA